ncbi:carbohydrate ABC transporter permease [Natronosporangium hydrolyticum]|uniref:Carbohydrate ABC transporter permease n=1 Tax=Natronosporangium hydrolyticum TaxID=2811111 RepID=A0A895YLB5_9ACTN|nr:carbohydrate ABC transporter permease [Natronosporangium hydrolyticum]QSB16765.1 carbohydrate ABC transporter permease [Natronosporangium hydrolyticum]
MIRRWLARGGPYAGFAVFALIFGVPVYWILLSAFLPSDQLLSDPPTYFTTRPTLDSVERTVDQVPLWTYLRNSVVFAVGSATLSVGLAFLAAYAFARLRFRGSNVVLLLLLLSMALPQIATTIPLFRLYQSLGLVDTLHGLVLLQGSLLIPLTVWLLISFVKQIPVELEEAAHIDGSNFVQMLYLVVWPLMKPALVTLFIINLITAWNELFFPLVFSNSVDTRTLTIGLIQLTQVTSGTTSRPWDLMATLAMFMIVPIIVLVVIGQRRIIAGLTAGSGK